MSPVNAIVLIALGWLALAGLALYVAYQLVSSGHPIFAALAGCFAGFAALASGSVELLKK